MDASMRPGDVIADRYRLIDLLNEARGALFWLAWDSVLARHVAVHLIANDDSRADQLRDAARRSATLLDRRLLRVLDIGSFEDTCYVVNEWGEGVSLNNMLADGPLTPRRAAWLIGEVGEFIAQAHRVGMAHGRLVPENVMIDEGGAVKVIGFAVDAALHGLPPGHISTEVVDLAGLLYAALTGTWPGVSTSSVRPAPQEHGRALRPRQVRAGVPRVLDTLCEEVLSPYPGTHDHGYDSAEKIVEALMEYVGDPVAMAEAEAERNRGNTSPRLPRIDALVWAPDPPAPPPEPASEPVSEKMSEPAEETVAGVPVFYDDQSEGVGWAARDESSPPPPPPFDEPPSRPLFAPDPPEGQAVRTPRPGAETDSAQFWPWDTGTGSVPPPLDEEPEEDDSVPGRNWMRIAWIIALSLLILVAMIYAFNRGRSQNGEASSGPGATQSSQPVKTTPLKLAGASDLDPYGDPPRENPDLAGLAIDGDVSTAWETMGYRQNFGAGGLKPGVGLVIDLGAVKDVGSVSVDVDTDPTSIQLFLASGAKAPTQVDAMEPVAKATSENGTLTLTPETASTARWVVIWLTSVPQDGVFRGRVSEVSVHG